MIKMTKKRQEDRDFVVKVCRAYYEYVDSSMEDVAKDLDISEGAVTKCIYIAGVKNWISFQELCSIKEKEHFQQCKHFDAQASRTPSDKRFENIIFPERRKYIRDTLTKEYCMKVARTYMENASKKDVHELIGLSRVEMNDVLIKGSILGYIPEADFQVLMEIATLKNGDKYIMHLIREYREDYWILPAEIEERERMLLSFDDVFSDADEIPEKTAIEADLERRKSRYAQIEWFIEHWHDKK